MPFICSFACLLMHILLNIPDFITLHYHFLPLSSTLSILLSLSLYLYMDLSHPLSIIISINISIYFYFYLIHLSLSRAFVPSFYLPLPPSLPSLPSHSPFLPTSLPPSPPHPTLSLTLMLPPNTEKFRRAFKKMIHCVRLQRGTSSTAVVTNRPRNNASRSGTSAVSTTKLTTKQTSSSSFRTTSKLYV